MSQSESVQEQLDIVIIDGTFPSDIAFRRALESFAEVAEVIEQDPAQPGGQFVRRITSELFETLLSFQEGLLDKIGLAPLAL